jgi:Arc/MetJ-type ribon-helix-helix transcriptional regulator
MKELRVLLPEELLDEIERRVGRGDFPTADELIQAAVKYYAERHGDANWDRYLAAEVEFSRRHAGR